MKHCPIGTEIQTLLFERGTKPFYFNEPTAKMWADTHGFKTTKTHVTKHQIRIRQKPPTHFRAGSFRTIQLAEGVEAVIGCPKKK